MSFIRGILFALGAAALSLTVAGCGDGDGGGSDGAQDVQDEDVVGEAEDDGDLDLDLGPDEVVIEQGEDSITSGAEFPEDFPSWAIRFPTDFTLQMVQSRDVGGVQGWIVLGTVPKTPDQVEFELLGSYGDLDEHETVDDAIRMRVGANGLDLEFTLTENADGNTAVTLNVAEG